MCSRFETSKGEEHEEKEERRWWTRRVPVLSPWSPMRSANCCLSVDAFNAYRN